MALFHKTFTILLILIGNCHGFSNEEDYAGNFESGNGYEEINEKSSNLGFANIPPPHNIKALQAQLHPQSHEVLQPLRPLPFFSADKSSSDLTSQSNVGNRNGLIHEANGPLSFVYIAAFLNSIFFTIAAVITAAQLFRTGG